MGLVGWTVVGALFRRYAPVLLARMAERGWLANLLAGLAVIVLERTIMSRRGSAWPRIVGFIPRGRAA
jgi:hypothetical protein